MKHHLFIATILFTALRLCAATPVRIAIIADEQAQPVSDLLTAKLSADKDLVLVERAEIDKVMQELKLSASGDLQHDLSLTRQLHADGIVILESQKIEGKPVVGARLVASAPGVVIGAGLFGGPPDALADSVATHFGPLWPKLTVARDSAIPVSLLNLRCVLKGSEALESQLTFLVAHQLMQQKEIFVLERWRMDDLALEKGLGEWNAGAFWNAGYVVDGRIDEDKDGKLKVVIFLQPPKGGAKQEIEIAGSTQNLRQISDDITSHITQALSKQPLKNEWKSEEEGKQYLNEARWAFEARLFPAARSAVEASWALGDRDPDVFRYRIRIYSALAFPLGTKPPHGIPMSGQKPRPMYYRTDVIDVSQGDGHLRAALQALDYFEEYATLQFPWTRNSDDEEEVLGSTPLLAASRVLRNYYDRGLAQGADAEDLVELRGRAREVAAQLFALDAALDQKTGLSSGGHPIYGVKYSYEIASVYLPFWCDSASQAVEGYRALLKRPFHEFVIRDHLLGHPRPLKAIEDECGSPWLVGWHGESGLELDKAWAAFLDSMDQSPETNERLDGALLREADAKTPEERKVATDKYCDLLWEKRDEIFQKKLAGVYFECMDRIVPYGHDDYRNAWLDYYLQNATAFNFSVLRFSWHPQGIPSPDAAAKVLAEWKGFKERLSAKGPLSSQIQNECSDFEESLFKKFPEVRPDVNAGASGIRTVQVTRNWQPDGSLGNFGRDMLWQEGQLWVAFTNPDEKRFTDAGKPYYRITFCNVQISSFKVTKYVETPEDMEVADIAYGPKFYLTPSSLFLRDKNAFRRYDRKQGTWTSFSLPERWYSRFFARGDDLYAAFSAHPNNESGILKWSAATGQIEVIASNRRRPASQLLDDRDPYMIGYLCGGPDGKLGVSVDLMNFYWHKPGTAVWETPFASQPLYGIAAGNCVVLASQFCGVAAVDNETGAMTVFPGSHFEKEGSRTQFVTLPDAFHTNVGPRAIEMPVMAYSDGHLWTLRKHPDEAGISMVLNRTERLDQPSLPASDARLIFQRAADNSGKDGTLPVRDPPVPVKQPFEVEMIATKPGMVFRIGGSGSLWFMPNEDFDASPATSAKTMMSK